MRTHGLVACLAMLVGGCVVPKLEAPQLDVTEVQLVRADLLQQELRVGMLVHNPNNRELAVRSIQYEVRVAGEAFAHGESDRDFTVPARGDTRFDVGVTANAAATVLRLIGGGRREAIDYQITGRITLANGLVHSVPFHHAGEFSLR